MWRKLLTGCCVKLAHTEYVALSLGHSASGDVAKAVEGALALFCKILTFSSTFPFALYLSYIILNINFHPTLETLGSSPSLKPSKKQHADSA